uniref:WAP domain-containing protein n=1 Tax=Syphacia muris TaxID=451379 RepID=A0A0N5AVN2_9BILA
MLVFSAIFLLQALISQIAAKMTWCEYFDKLGIYRPECAQTSVVQPENQFYHYPKKQQMNTYDALNQNIISNSNFITNTNFMPSRNTVSNHNVIPNSNFMPSQNAISGHNIIPNTNFMPNQKAVLSRNVIPNPNVIPNRNVISDSNVMANRNGISNSNVMQNWNGISNSNVMPNRNGISNSNVMPNRNGISNSNVMPNRNGISNRHIIPNSNIIPNPNVFPYTNGIRNRNGISNSNAMSSYPLNFHKLQPNNVEFMNKPRPQVVDQFYSTAMTRRPKTSVRNRILPDDQAVEVTKTMYRTIGTTPKPNVYAQFTIATTARISSRTPDECISEIHLTNCRRSNRCASGEVCLQDGKACCVRAPRRIEEAQCPSPQLLMHSCETANFQKDINWCKRDRDCKYGVSQKCCPTLCNYNVCVNLRRPPVSALPNSALIPKRVSQCPNPEALEVNCVRTRKYVSWCQEDSHCNGKNKYQKRICCPTRCDYNVCLLKYLGKWIIA